MRQSDIRQLFETMVDELASLEERQKLDEARALFRLLNVCLPENAMTAEETPARYRSHF